MDHEQAGQILEQIHQLTSTERFRNFVAQAQSRTVLQYLRADPANWPNYSPNLDETLLYSAHILIWQGIQIRSLPQFRNEGDQAVKLGSEILEFIYSHSFADSVERTDQLFNAALGYYISGHYARAHVLMKDIGNTDNLPQELQLLRRLFLKNLRGIRHLILEVLTDERNADAFLTAGLNSDVMTQDEALDRVMRVSLNRAFSYFVEFPKNGRRDILERAKEILDVAIDLAEKVRFVSWWWLLYCARHMFDEYDDNSLWTQLNPLLGDDGGDEIVGPYIRASYRRKTPIIEYWRSQTTAIPRINEDERRSYCLKMPTSAGKTRVAELAILRFLLDFQDAPDTKCIYIAPFRSLAVEIEKTLQESFLPLGIRVSELYGGFELSPTERMLIERTRIIIATPEKIDAFLRYNPEFAEQVRLIIVDEGHIVGPTERGIRFEFFLHRMVKRFGHNSRILFVSAVLPNTDQFATWITGDPDNLIQSDWRPSRLLIGELRWNGRFSSVYYTHSGDTPLEHECYVASFINPLKGSQLKGTGRHNPFPNNMKEVVADAALRFAQQDMTLVFVAQRRSVEPFGRELLKAIRIKNIIEKRGGGGYQLPVSSETEDLRAECIALAEETMGSDAEIIAFLKAGFVVHHSALPQRLRIKLEQLVRSQGVRLVVATTTLAQGVNFPIRTVLVHSLYHGEGESMTPLNFWNICGRAGRGMRENEGQVLFAVHLVENDPDYQVDRSLSWDDQQKQRKKRRDAIFSQRRQAELRQQIIEGYGTFQLVSGLRNLLEAIVRQWNILHPTVDVAELCVLLAENKLDWLQPGDQARLDFLDSQIVALTEEQNIEIFTPDDLQEILQGFLPILQIQSDPDGILTPEEAIHLLYSRLQSIRNRFPLASQRQRLYFLGFPLSDCERVETNKSALLSSFLAAAHYHLWEVETRCHYMVSILTLMFDTIRVLGGNEISALRKDEIWRNLWKPVLGLWLRGLTPDEIVQSPEVALITDSPALVSQLIDHLFGYKAPWGLNALSVYLQRVATDNAVELPEVAGYFSALLKYGVHSPLASALLAFGLESRELALRLAEHGSDEMLDAQEQLHWFLGLTQVELRDFGLSDTHLKTVLEAQENAHRVARVSTYNRRTNHITLQIEQPILEVLAVGDNLVLQMQPEDKGTVVSAHTLWGDLVGYFEDQENIPDLWTFPEKIEVIVNDIELESTKGTLSIEIREV